MKRKRAWLGGWVLTLPALTLLACEASSTGGNLVREARVGVFFGGQIQQREELARVFDDTQSQGFRLVFREPLSESKRVRWEIALPARSGAPEVAVSKLGEVTVPIGQREIDQVFRFEPGDPLGVWNIRVLVDDALVIDRAWLVFDAAARRQADRSAD